METSNFSNIGSRIRKERRSKGLSQSILSKNLGISASYLNLIESGRRTITVPLLMIEFYIILKAVGASVSSNSFWRLLVGTLVMLIGGYLGEAQVISATLGFIIGMIGWAVIIWEIFGGEASKAADANAGIKSAFNALRIIVLVGWAIYPLGYVFGYMLGSVDPGSLNVIYNLADFVNKILFGLIIWNVAVKESA